MKNKKNIVGILIGIVTAILISSIYIFGTFKKLQYISSDFLRTAFTKNIKKSDIVYLLITDATIIEADEIDGIRWPWPRQAYGEAINFLNNAGTKHIAFDMTFSETSVHGADGDEIFEKSLKTGNVTLSYLSTNKRGNANIEKIERIY